MKKSIIEKTEKQIEKAKTSNAKAVFMYINSTVSNKDTFDITGHFIALGYRLEHKKLSYHKGKLFIVRWE